MQKYSKIALLLSTSLLFHPSANRTAFAMESKEQINIDIDTNDNFTLKNGLICNKGYNNIQKEIDTYNDIVQKVNERFDRIEERQKLEEQKKIEEEKYNRNFIVTYYGATYNECGNNHFITASGIPVSDGHIAVPKNIPFGSKIILEGREYVATDTGNPKYICELSDGTLRVDVFIPRQHGESDYQYEKRVNNMGTKNLVGKLYIKG